MAPILQSCFSILDKIFEREIYDSQLFPARGFFLLLFCSFFIIYVFTYSADRFSIFTCDYLSKRSKQILTCLFAGGWKTKDSLEKNLSIWYIGYISTSTKAKWNKNPSMF